MSYGANTRRGVSAGSTDPLDSTSGSSSPLGPSRFLNRTQKRLQKDLSDASSPLGVDSLNLLSPGGSPTPSLFVTAPDTIPPPMVPSIGLGDPRYIVRAAPKEYTDPSALTSRARREGPAFTPEQAYVRLLRREVKLAQKATARAGEVPPLVSSSSMLNSPTAATSSGGTASTVSVSTPWSASAAPSNASVVEVPSVKGKKGGRREKGDRPQLACDALNSPMKTKKSAEKRVRREKGGVARSPTDDTMNEANSAEDDENADDDAGDDEDGTVDGVADTATDYINPFSPSASPKMRAAAEARAAETAALLDALDVVHATWDRDGAQLFQTLYEEGQFQQSCARDGVAAFAKDLGTVEAVSTLPPYDKVREQAQRLSQDVCLRGTAMRRAAPVETAPSEERAFEEARDTSVPASSAAVYAAPWALLEPSVSDAPSSAVAGMAGMPVTAQDVEREMHMRLIETKLKYLVDYELRVGQNHLRRALRGDGTDAYDVTGGP